MEFLLLPLLFFNYKQLTFLDSCSELNGTFRNRGWGDSPGKFAQWDSSCERRVLPFTITLLLSRSTEVYWYFPGSAGPSFYQKVEKYLKDKAEPSLFTLPQIVL